MVFNFGNGQEGIDKALNKIPDIIISDVMMPKKNGFEVCEALKADERTSHIPIILLTAKAATEDRIEGLKVGADAFLTKPFNKQELFVRLEKLLELRKALQERFSSTEYLLTTKSPKSEPSMDEVFLKKLIDVVLERLDDPNLGVVDLCRTARLSHTHVNWKLKAMTFKTPSRFIRSIRLPKAVELLKTTDLNVSEIAYDVGFSDPNYFSRSFSEEFGYPPNVIRK
jgi:YesN/AraC family two-component response regulator